MKRVVWMAIVAVAFGASRSALARDEEPPRVVVHVGASVGRAEADRLVSAVRGQLRGAARVSTDDDDGAACAVSIDRNEADQLVVRFTDPASGEALGERMVTHGGELGASEVGTIVRAFMVAQSERPAPTADSSPPATPSVAAPPAPAAVAAQPPATVADAPAFARVAAERPSADADAAAPRSWRARIGVFYTGSSYASALPWQSGVRVAATASLPYGLYAGVAYAYFLPSEVDRDVASVRLARHVGDAYFGIERGRGRLSAAADVGGGFAIGIRSTAGAGSSVVATPDATHVTPMLRAALHGRYRIPQLDEVALDVAAALEVAPAERDLVVDEGSSTTTLLSPAVTRLRLDIGATFDAF